MISIPNLLNNSLLKSLNNVFIPSALTEICCYGSHVSSSETLYFLDFHNLIVISLRCFR